MTSTEERPRLSPTPDRRSLQFSHVDRRFGRRHALRDVSLEFGVGLHCVLGPNGAGKTTLLRLAATVDQPTDGVVRVAMTPTGSKLTEIRQQLGYVPQDYGFYPRYSPERFLDYVGCLRGYDRDRRRLETDRVLEMVGLVDRRTDQIRRLSGGMRRRLGVAVGLLGSPAVVLLDEPFVGLDPAQRVHLTNVLRAAAEHSVVVVATHQTDDVAGAFDSVGILDNGSVCFHGSVNDLRAKAEGVTWLSGTSSGFAGQVRSAGEGEFRWITQNPPPDSRPVPPTVEDAYLWMVGPSSDEQGEVR